MLRLLVLFPGGVAALLASALVVVLVFAVMVSVFEWYLCVHALVRGWMADGWMDGWREGGREGWREGGRDGWMEGGREGGMEGWRDGGMEGWRDGGMEGWRDGGMEGWRDGGMEGWRDGGMEGWRDGGTEGGMPGGMEAWRDEGVCVCVLLFNGFLGVLGCWTVSLGLSRQERSFVSARSSFRQNGQIRLRTPKFPC